MASDKKSLMFDIYYKKDLILGSVNEPLISEFFEKEFNTEDSL